MFIIVTRNFPPDIGGIQSLVGGLSENLLNHGPVKVFADEYPNSEIYDKKSSLNISRIDGIKLFRKFRKANLVNDFIQNNNNIRALLVDHWKSLELIKTENLKKIKVFCLIHSKEINHDIGSSLNRRLLKRITVSTFSKQLRTDSGVVDFNKFMRSYAIFILTGYYYLRQVLEDVYDDKTNSIDNDKNGILMNAAMEHFIRQVL